MVRMFLGFLIALNLCSCIAVVHHKEKLIDVESIDTNKNILKTEGFYYHEYEYDNQNHFVKMKDAEGNYYNNIKYIKTFILNKDGLVIKGGEFNGVSDYFCTESNLPKKNTYINAIKKYKSILSFMNENNSTKPPRTCRILENDIDGKGLFKIENGNITIQYYKAESKIEDKDSSNSYYLYELRGEVISSESFKINQIINHRKSSNEDVNMVFIFEEDKNIPKISNYFKN